MSDDRLSRQEGTNKPLVMDGCQVRHLMKELVDESFLDDSLIVEPGGIGPGTDPETTYLSPTALTRFLHGAENAIACHEDSGHENEALIGRALNL